MHTFPDSRQLWYAAMRLHLLEQIVSTPFWNHDWARKQAVQILKGYAARSPEPAAWWPALVRLVDTEHDRYILNELADWPLPDTVPPGIQPWYTALVNAWDRKRDTAGDDMGKGFVIRNIALKALVKLDACAPPPGEERPSRLPEWLAETRRIPGWAESFRCSDRLETLAMWRPARRVSASPDDLRQWWQFWEDAHGRIWKWGDDRLIPTLLQAQLNFTTDPVLNETYGSARLMDKLGDYIRKAASGTARLYIWQPSPHQIAGQGAAIRLADVLLNAAVFMGGWENRQGIWRMLLAIERAGLDKCLWNDFVTVLNDALQNDPHLWDTLSAWVPSPALVAAPAIRKELTAIHNGWVKISRHPEAEMQDVGWTGRFNFMVAGLPPDMAEEELEELCQVIRRAKPGAPPLPALAAWQPPAHFPAAWQTAWRRSWGATLKQAGDLGLFPGWLVLEHHSEHQTPPPAPSGPPRWRDLRNIRQQMYKEVPGLAETERSLPGFRLSRIHELMGKLVCQTPSELLSAICPPAKTPSQPLALPRPEATLDGTEQGLSRPISSIPEERPPHHQQQQLPPAAMNGQ